MIFAAAQGDEVQVLLELGSLLILLAALARLAHRVGLSPIPLYLGAGLLLGPGGPFPLDASAAFIDVAEDIGLVLLLLMLGLQYTPDELVSTLRSSTAAGAVDLVLNFLPGLAAGFILGWSPLAAVFLGGITYISSSGVIAKVLSDLGRTGNRETPTILAVLVLEDLAMAVYLPIVAGLAVGGATGNILLSIGVGLAVVVAVLTLMPRIGDRVGSIVFSRSDEVLVFSILGLALLGAGLAEQLHISAAVGAFIVGIAISGPAARVGAPLLSPLRDVFAAAFFLFFTIQIDLGNLADALVPAAMLAVVTAATKVATGWWSAQRAGIGPRGRLRAGTILIARGEFSIVIAGLATLNGVEDDLGALAAAYVLVLAVLGPVITRFSDPIVERWERRGAPAG
jgi:monovalent cation:H+ antiporter-2, CPA2 family